MAVARTSKGKEAVAIFAPDLASFIESVSAVERCSALAVSNALLLKAAQHWGQEITHQPMKINPDVIAASLDALHERYQSLEEKFDITDGSNIKDIYVMACKWEMVATQVVMVTIAASLSRDYAITARQAWGLLAKSRHVAAEAVLGLVQYGKTYQDSPIPLLPGKHPTQQYLYALATNLPPMFRSSAKKAAKK